MVFSKIEKLMKGLAKLGKTTEFFQKSPIQQEEYIKYLFNLAKARDPKTSVPLAFDRKYSAMAREASKRVVAPSRELLATIALDNEVGPLWYQSYAEKLVNNLNARIKSRKTLDAGKERILKDYGKLNEEYFKNFETTLNKEYPIPEWLALEELAPETMNTLARAKALADLSGSNGLIDTLVTKHLGENAGLDYFDLIMHGALKGDRFVFNKDMALSTDSFPLLLTKVARFRDPNRFKVIHDGSWMLPNSWGKKIVEKTDPTVSGKKVLKLDHLNNKNFEIPLGYTEIPLTSYADKMNKSINLFNSTLGELLPNVQYNKFIPPNEAVAIRLARTGKSRDTIKFPGLIFNIVNKQGGKLIKR